MERLRIADEIYNQFSRKIIYKKSGYVQYGDVYFRTSIDKGIYLNNGIFSRKYI